MIKPRVYLAGAIAGLHFDEATDWRKQAGYFLQDRGIETLDPMRAKNALGSQGKISDNFNDYRHNGAFFESKGIMTRDFTDVKRSDAVLINLLGLTRPSLGTVMELAWCYAFQKPVVVCIEKSGNPHDNHPMIAAAMSFRVETLAEGIDAVAIILNR